jgi:DNA-binding cell septation regulator SpoVG
VTIQQLRVMTGASKLKAFFNLELDNGIVVKGFKIAEGPSGLFVGMPSEKDKDGKYWDRVFIPRELKEEVTTLAIGAYDAFVAGGGQSAPTAEPSTPDLPF